MRASVEILRAAYQQFGSGMCAVWREVPQSSARCVTRFLSHAQEAGDHEIQRLFLAACRLEEETVWARYAAVPPLGKQMRDALWEVRGGAGEILDELSVTRDMLHVSLWQGVMANTSDEPFPEWTGATADRGMVHRQYVAAHEFLTRLRAEYERTSNSDIV